MAAWILDISYFLQQKRGEYPTIYLDRARSSKDLLYGQKYFFLLCNKMGNSHRAKEAHIAHSRSSQSEQRIRFILPEAPGGSSWEFLVGVCCPVLQILTLSQTQKCHFSRPSSELACKNYVIIT